MDAAALDRFFAPLGYMFTAAKETQKQLDRYLASGFNLIDVLWPDENRISNVLAQLLSPSGGHGQGELFLGLFLEHLRHAGLDLTDSGQFCDIQTEHLTTEGRRIDLLIEWDHLVIAIEHKMGAADQWAQIQDYHTYLKTLPSKRYCLLYLTAYSQGPSEVSLSMSARQELEKEGHFKVLSHNPFLLGWCQAAAQQCEAEKIRWFLRDFADWCSRYPNGGGQ